jgi:hypothetical protein
MMGPMEEQETKPEGAHDVLAAEAFAMPAPDPDLHHHGPVNLPDDPSGIAEPHDVLAAEEFPMPAARPHPAVALVERRGGVGRLAFEVGGALVLFALLRRVLRRR